MDVEVQVHRGRCIGSKACINAAPGAFELDETGVATVREPNPEPLEALLEAADCCPTGAITVLTQRPGHG
ncbi:MAG TPA: ferredoxin [Acidimicrobiales bacterium]|nr:ferredoxin [Acidimicrobiales bacterium]